MRGNAVNSPKSDTSSARHPSAQWRLMSAYERFEQLVVIALSLIIAAVILMALLQLCRSLLPLLITGAIDPLDHGVFQSVFGSIFTVLIALEFKHSIIRPALRRDSVVQVRTVLLIALLALSRKFVILDTLTTPALTIAALGFATLVLGVVCWLLGKRDLSVQD
ncbi:uncharacterized membrane protein (DUF373 family) [Pseudomonas graminis]|nr:phosphate-starvation-inducible PsiE family protein [Pseudomonas graminis]TDV50316.1 uncharacterized membrane protein (DUF373 family) [Pseudomonas graminis]